MAVVIRTMVMAAVTVMMLVVIAAGIRIIFQRPFCKSLCRSIRRPLNAGIKPDPGISQCHLSPHTDPATDQGICFYRMKETGKCAVSAPFGIHNLLTNNLPIFHIIQLELFGMTEMLENLSVFISNRDSHCF